MKICREVRFLRCIWADLDVIMNAERFTRTDRIHQVFDYELKHVVFFVCYVSVQFSDQTPR